MTTPAPAFQFYPADYLGSLRVQMMTLEEEGAYIRLMSYCWKNGSIPADPELVSRLIGKGASTTLATTVLSMFKIADCGTKYSHERLDLEREKQRIWREKSSSGGRKSAETRAAKAGKSKKAKGASTTLATTPQPPPQPNGNSSSSSSSINNKARGTRDDLVAFALEIGLTETDGESMFERWESNGWRNGNAPVKDWKAGMRNWKLNKWHPSQKNNATSTHLNSHGKSHRTDDLNQPGRYGSAVKIRDTGPPVELPGIQSGSC